jgi:hypothetical protein
MIGVSYMPRRARALLLLVLLHAGADRALGAERGRKPPEGGAVASAKGPPQATGPEVELSRAKLAYERGDYGAAIALLRPLLYPEVLLADEVQVVLGHKLLGMSLFFERDEAGAEQEFNLLLQIRPDFTLDPLVEPMKAVAFFDSLRKRNEGRLGEIRRRQQDEASRQRAAEEAARQRAEVLAKQQAPRVYIERVVSRRVSVLHFVPFGVPQLLEGRRPLGIALAVCESSMLAASLGTWLTVRLRYPEGRFPSGEYGTATGLTATYLTSGAVFWSLVAAGLIEALWHSRTEVTFRELPGPPSDLPPHLVPRPVRSRGAALRPLPFIPVSPLGAEPAGLGLSLGGPL